MRRLGANGLVLWLCYQHIAPLFWGFGSRNLALPRAYEREPRPFSQCLPVLVVAKIDAQQRNPKQKQ
jgi:hypothetical protein